MVEKLRKTVVKHHADRFLGDYDWFFESELLEAAETKALVLSRRFLEDGRPKYPNLRNATTRNAYAAEQVEQYLALCSGTAVIISDTDTLTNRPNIDGSCQICGNYKIPNQCSKSPKA